MRVDMHLKDIELTPYTREQVEKKLTKILSRLPKDVPLKVSFEDERQTYRAQVQVHHLGKEVIGRGESKNILTALENAIVRVDRQFSRIHELNMHKE
jgi:ribosomal subunit interface protein